MIKKVLIFFSLLTLVISCNYSAEKENQVKFFSLFKSVNIVINEKKLTYQVCDKNTYNIKHTVEFNIVEVIEKIDTITYLLQNNSDSMWSQVKLIKKHKELFEFHEPFNYFESKTDLENEIKVHPNNVNYLKNYSYFSTTKSNRSVIDVLLLGNYFDLWGNQFSISESQIKAKLLRMDDFTGDFYIEKVTYSIIDRRAFGKGFYYILQNESSYYFLYYRWKTETYAIFSLDEFGYNSKAELVSNLNLWIDKKSKPICSVLISK